MKEMLYFTLIELIIVIAIMMILISILFPAISKAKNKAKVISCVNNLKQQMLVCVSYASDWNEYFPYNYVPGTAHPASSYGRSRYLEAVYPSYINNGHIYYCPGNNFNIEYYGSLTYESNFYPSSPGSSSTTYFYYAWNLYGDKIYESPYHLAKKGIYSDIISTDAYSTSANATRHGAPAQINTLYRDGHVTCRNKPRAWNSDLF